MDSLVESKPKFDKFFEHERLELFCYYSINRITGKLDCIVNSPVTLNAFPAELIDADLVYSHLPVVDKFDGQWVAQDWKIFFQNIFNAPNSRVKSIIIAANYRSEGLRDFCLLSSEKALNCFDVKVLNAPICNGLLVIIRRSHLF